MLVIDEVCGRSFLDGMQEGVMGLVHRWGVLALELYNNVLRGGAFWAAGQVFLWI